MIRCPSCDSELANNVRYCSACGKPVENTDDIPTLDFETATSPLPRRPPSSRSQSGHRSPSSGSSSSRSSNAVDFQLAEGRFLPGRLVAGRYRIIALLGRGGMGEVYRADDLTLGQAVALKFLPDEAASDEGLLERFRNEVRIARKVSHPNICRVYDVGDVDGQTFFTMEYIDGEDLASLLRRIGRLPSDKAVEIARQVCAGLAAAHAKGVLHRDLKPANIMLDGRGQAVIMDFGLAGVADNIRGAEVRSGTPAYMSPEQIAGTEVTMRSDIYSLGLVLYEVFTGKRAFAETKAGTIHGAADRTPSRPSSMVKDLDPVIEKVILRCLETQPSGRPANALAVAAALPGGDPLAAALAAGETPSPQMVAAAGDAEGLRPRAAVIVLAAILIGLSAAIYIMQHYDTYQKMGLELTPEVLAQKSREIISRAGYEGRPADSAYGLESDGDFESYVEKNDKPQPDWDAVITGRPSMLQYWYRQSPDDMVAADFRDSLLIPGIVTEHDPPTTLSGMINVQLDPRGRLTYFQVIPPEKFSNTEPANASSASSTVPAASYDWNVLFNAAGLDLSKFQSVQPAWNSLANSDARAAWTGTWPGTTRPLRVEAASFQAKPVYFSLIGPWTKPQRMADAEKKSLGDRIGRIIGIFLLIGGLGGGAWLARRNYRHGRGDRQGALRLAIVIFLLQLSIFFCLSHLATVGDAIGLTIIAMSTALFIAGVIWMLYMAVEPFVRRHWPKTIISWSRLLAGGWRDPVVGRDVLLGVALGIVWIVVFNIRYVIIIHLGASPGMGGTNTLMGGRTALGAWLRQWPQSIQTTLIFFLVLLGLKVLLRKEWIAAIVFIAIWAVPRGLTESHRLIEMPVQILVYTIALLIVLRFGLVPLAVAIFTIDMVASIPFPGDLSVWYVPSVVMQLLSVLVLAGWGFYHSLGGQRIWAGEEE
jgi:predicted Ser/Thr protein kinase